MEWLITNSMCPWTLNTWSLIHSECLSPYYMHHEMVQEADSYEGLKVICNCSSEKWLTQLDFILLVGTVRVVSSMISVEWYCSTKSKHSLSLLRSTMVCIIMEYPCASDNSLIILIIFIFWCHSICCHIHWNLCAAL